MQFGRPARVPMWIAGICVFLLAAGATVAVVRPIPSSYTGIPDESSRAQHAVTPSGFEDAQTEDAPERATILRVVIPDTQGRCRECGVIESMRQVERPGDADRQYIVDVKVADGAQRSYEFTVRLRDGSTAVFREATSRSMRVGSRVIVIGGAKAAHN